MPKKQEITIKAICIFLSLSFGFIKYVSPQSVACADCYYGVVTIEGSGSLVARYGQTNTSALSYLSALLSAGFIGLNATQACEENACGSNSVCSVNTTNIFVCDCEDQFMAKRETQKFNCLDEDECETNTHNCSLNGGVCTNTAPGFTCKCGIGYTGNGYKCAKIVSEYSCMTSSINIQWIRPNVRMRNLYKMQVTNMINEKKKETSVQIAFAGEPYIAAVSTSAEGCYTKTKSSASNKNDIIVEVFAKRLQNEIKTISKVISQVEKQSYTLTFIDFD